MVTVLAFYSDDSGSNRSEVYNFLWKGWLKRTKINKRGRKWRLFKVSIYLGYCQYSLVTVYWWSLHTFIVWINGTRAKGHWLRNIHLMRKMNGRLFIYALVTSFVYHCLSSVVLDVFLNGRRYYFISFKWILLKATIFLIRIHVEKEWLGKYIFKEKWN